MAGGGADWEHERRKYIRSQARSVSIRTGRGDGSNCGNMEGSAKRRGAGGKNATLSRRGACGVRDSGGMRQRFSALGIALAAGLLVSASLGAGLFAGLENFFEDLLFFEKPIHGDIVIVAIDDESLSRIGQWPWPRQVFADFLKALEKTPPRVVALDVLFAEPSRVGREDDEAFSRALRTLSYSVVLPVEGREIRLDGERGVETDFLIEPREEFRGSRRVAFGHVNVIE